MREGEGEGEGGEGQKKKESKVDREEINRIEKC